MKKLVILIFIVLSLAGCSSSIKGIEERYPPGKTHMSVPKGVGEFEKQSQLKPLDSYRIAEAVTTQSSHGRILAAGGFISGVVSGS